MDNFEVVKNHKSAAQSIRDNKEAILSLWEHKIKEEIVAAGAISKPVLIDEIPEFLDRLILCLDTSHNTQGGSEVSQRHGEERARTGLYNTESIVHEYFLLKKIICKVVKGETVLAEEDSELIGDFIQIATKEAVKRFSELQILARRINEERLNFAAELSQIGIWEYDFKTKNIWKTGTNDLIFGFKKPFVQWTYDLFIDFVHPEDRQVVKSKLGQFSKADNIWVIEFRIILENNQTKWVEVKGKVLRSENSSPLKIVGTNIDVTEKKKSAEDSNRYAVMAHRDLENLKAEREVRDRFVSALTHDLRTPLTAGRIAAQLVLRFADDADKVKKTAKTIIDSIDRTDRMINDLLDANRIRAGQELPISFKELDLSEILKTMVDEFSAYHRSRIILTTPKNLIGFWDGEALRRAVENLINNAFKYGFQDTPVSIIANDLGESVKISVHNFGHEVSEIEQKTLFDEFMRSRAAERSGQKGWGIGLTLVRGFVESHCGNVKVESKKDVGTSFVITLPKKCDQ